MADLNLVIAVIGLTFFLGGIVGYLMKSLEGDL